ncbi:Uncharacterised protein r2_g1270 [Pycnogonum litorale]
MSLEGENNLAHSNTPHIRPQSLPLPEKFTCDASNCSQAWPKWLKRFDGYRIASELAQRPENEQVSIFFYAMGDIADDILATLDIDEESTTYSAVRDAINKYFRVRRSTGKERARFNKRIQQPGEPVEIFIQDLYKIAEYCEYGNLKNELIRDRIIAGVNNDDLSETLQAKDDLTLEQAIHLSRQAEARKHDRALVSGETATAHISPVWTTKATKKNWMAQNSLKTVKPCPWCGGKRHTRTECPAKDADCRSCQKKGHYQAVCRNKQKKSQEVQELQDIVDATKFLGEIAGHGDHWSVTLAVNKHNVKFKLDTGATVMWSATRSHG